MKDRRIAVGWSWRTDRGTQQLRVVEVMGRRFSGPDNPGIKAGRERCNKVISALRIRPVVSPVHNRRPAHNHVMTTVVTARLPLSRWSLYSGKATVGATKITTIATAINPAINVIGIFMTLRAAYPVGEAAHDRENVPSIDLARQARQRRGSV